MLSHDLLIVPSLHVVSPFEETFGKDLAFPLHFLEDHSSLFRGDMGFRKQFFQSESPDIGHFPTIAVRAGQDGHPA